MSRHDYTNQAFCQDDETKIRRCHSVRSVRRYPNEPIKEILESAESSDRKSSTSKLLQSQFPIPHSSRGNGTKCAPGAIYDMRASSRSIIKQSTIGSRYALVPMEYLRRSRSNIYGSTSSCLSRSHENLFSSRDEINSNNITIDGSNNFSSLPPLEMRNHMTRPRTTNRALQPAFSNDFGSKSFLTLDNKYYIVPTEENEEIVDENHEIIQVHPNGQTHRYAVIPSSPETADSTDRNNMQHVKSPMKFCDRPVPAIPMRNSPATQKLHELLSTPVKNSRPASRASTYLSPRRTTSTPFKQMGNDSTSPRKLNFDQRSLFMASSTTLNYEQKTTAVIPPRVNSAAAPIYNECSTLNSDQNNESNFKRKIEIHRRTIALIGYTSMILIILGVINSALCIYITSVSSVSNAYVSNIFVKNCLRNAFI